MTALWRIAGGLTGALRIMAAALAAGALVALYGALVVIPSERRDAIAEEKARQLKVALDAIERRNETDEAVRNLDDRGLCRELGGGMLCDE